MSCIINAFNNNAFNRPLSKLAQLRANATNVNKCKQMRVNANKCEQMRGAYKAQNS
ncbi:hypothetical protein [Candidatus Sarmatiella mevalonica]|uniref:hypothetical protein n=1 Tax=Candidatus Sarmatiella mevalonica TaxID=2770581 RepID=UPI00192246C6|nr:hypothetical protein [Candidatus Sarmatiella mevalonica]